MNLDCPAGADATESHRYLYGGIYFALRGKDPAGVSLTWTDSAGAPASAPSTIWTVKGTGDSVAFGNNDDIDRLTVPLDDFIFGITSGGSPTNHSWYDIENTAIGIRMVGDFHHNNFVTPTALAFGWRTSILGFGVANGGGDGDTNDPPTATDQHRIWTDGANDYSSVRAELSGNLQVATPHKLHVWASTDGEAWRIIAFRNSFSVFAMFIEKPKDPVVLGGAPTHTWNGADSPYVAVAQGAEADGAANRAMQFDNWHGANNRLRSHMANSGDTTLNTAVDCVMACERMATGGDLEAHRRSISQLDDNRPFGPIAIWGETAGFTGRAGIMNDIWMGNDTDQGVAEGDNYPDDASRQFVAVSNFILPSNGAVILTT